MILHKKGITTHLMMSLLLPLTMCCSEACSGFPGAALRTPTAYKYLEWVKSPSLIFSQERLFKYGSVTEKTKRRFKK